MPTVATATAPASHASGRVTPHGWPRTKREPLRWKGNTSHRASGRTGRRDPLGAADLPRTGELVGLAGGRDALPPSLLPGGGTPSPEARAPGPSARRLKATSDRTPAT